jgi:hypothetical protein
MSQANDGTSTSAVIVPLFPRRPPQQKSQYELYDLPFMNGDAEPVPCMWNVKATVDCETGRAYAVAFLKTADFTNGWSAMLPGIVADMIRAGPQGRSQTALPASTVSSLGSCLRSAGLYNGGPINDLGASRPGV